MILEMMLCVHINQVMILEMMLCVHINQVMILEMMFCVRIKSGYDSRDDVSVTQITTQLAFDSLQ